MAFNVQTFRTRTLSAVVFLIIMLAGLFINQWTFFLLFSVIHFGCWSEYQKLVGQIDKEYQEITPFHKYGVMIAGWCILLYLSNNNYRVSGLHLHELGWWIGLMFVFVLPIMELLFTKNIRVKNIGHSVFGLLYISLSLGLMMNMRKDYFLSDSYILDAHKPWHSVVLPCIIVFSLWINDTMAYIIGSLIGKTPLTRISPKKTWEGTIGGIILALIVIGLISWWLDFDTRDILIISAVTVIAGTFGDILESKLKRLAGVKDSGKMMPGHGGFLDRFDSLLVAIPFAWLYTYVFITW